MLEHRRSPTRLETNVTYYPSCDTGLLCERLKEEETLSVIPVLGAPDLRDTLGRFLCPSIQLQFSSPIEWMLTLIWGLKAFIISQLTNLCMIHGVHA